MIRAIALTGPTASGKTALAIPLAKRIGGEIICMDSMQIYRYMDIGTAKPTPHERAEVPHHMTDFLSPGENYSAADYKEAALATAGEIVGRGRVPLFVGGTGLYLDTLLYSFTQRVPAADAARRPGCAPACSDPHALWERLRAVDPESAEKIHENNTRRVARALEIYETTGRTKTEWDRENRLPDPRLSLTVITLDVHDRENLYRRTDLRVEEMVRQGLPQEVEQLLHAGYLSGENTASQAIGYKEFLPWLRGERSLDDCVADLKTATRRYAKRQLTWFRHETDAVRIWLDTPDGVPRTKEELLGELFRAAEGAGYPCLPAEKTDVFASENA